MHLLTDVIFLVNLKQNDDTTNNNSELPEKNWKTLCFPSATGVDNRSFQSYLKKLEGTMLFIN